MRGVALRSSACSIANRCSQHPVSTAHVCPLQSRVTTMSMAAGFSRGPKPLPTPMVLWVQSSSESHQGAGRAPPGSKKNRPKVHLSGPWSQVSQFNVNTTTSSCGVSKRPTRIEEGTTGERTAQKWWPRGDSKPEKPTQGAPARAACTGKARLARRFAHESERRFGVYWAHRGTKGRSTRRRNRFLNGCLRFLTPAPFPPHARSFTQPGQSIFEGD